MIIWGFDVSYYQSQGSMLGNGRYDLSDLNRFSLNEMRGHGCRFGIAKYSMQLSHDQTADDHTRMIKEADMQAGGYHWCDPIDNYPLQSNLFTEKINQLTPTIQAYDVEQYWSSWTDKTKMLTQNQIVDNFLYLFGETGGLVHNQLIYTARWFTNSYVPTRSDELNVCDAWLAHYTMARNYVQSQFGSYRLTSWDQFHQLLEYLNDNWQTWFDGSTPARILFPNGFNDWRIWQFDSKLILPGAPYNIDLNLFNGTEAEYEEWAGIAQEPEPPQPPDPTQAERLRAEAESLRRSADNLENIATLISGG